MNHLKTFETFIIPKPVRKFMPFWKDEDIALQVLKELKSMQGNSEEISKLAISSETDEDIDRTTYKFNLDGFNFEVYYGFTLGPGGGSFSGSLSMNDNDLFVSDEVCKKIENMILSLMGTNEYEISEYDKKDFRMRIKDKKKKK